MVVDFVSVTVPSVPISVLWVVVRVRPVWPPSFPASVRDVLWVVVVFEEPGVLLSQPFFSGVVSCSVLWVVVTVTFLPSPPSPPVPPAGFFPEPSDSPSAPPAGFCAVPSAPPLGFCSFPSVRPPAPGFAFPSPV